MAFLKRAKCPAPRLAISTRTRVARLHERLFLETDPRVRESILAQLAALDRKPAGR
jgi:hypothetical protein